MEISRVAPRKRMALVPRPKLDDDELLFHENKKVRRNEMVPCSPTEQRVATIACYDCGHFVSHKFVGKRGVCDNAGTVMYIEQIYACPACNRTRVYGTETP
jgi:hypothetical protein